MIQVPQLVIEQSITYGTSEPLSRCHLFRHEWADTFTLRRQRFAWLRLENVVLAVRQQPVSDARVPPAHDEDYQNNTIKMTTDAKPIFMFVIRCSKMFETKKWQSRVPS